jgi:hypothetical protein
VTQPFSILPAVSDNAVFLVSSQMSTRTTRRLKTRAT